MENIYAERVAGLRRIMGERGWDVLVFTGSDPHGSEYPAGRWKQVNWISGFSGEAGDLVITATHAGLWTDTRYFLAAAEALRGTGIELHKTRIPEQVLIPEWIAREFEAEREIVLAVDGLCVSAGFVEDIVNAAQEAGTDCLVASVPNLLDPFWTDRPGIPDTEIFTVETGEGRKEKIEWLRNTIQADGILLTSLDDIAWLLNVRASDIEYNPLCISYLLVTQKDVQWFVSKEREPMELEDVKTMPYADIELALDSFEGLLQIDSSTINYHLLKSINVDVIDQTCPVPLRKAVKNEYEIEGMKTCHVRDGVAMEKFLFWLEKTVEAQRCITEWDAAKKLGEFRAEGKGYHGDSFETISAYGPSAALPHYVTPREDAPVLYEKGIYLVDSGGQYDDGTTDITRTVPLGHCSDIEKEDYTLVLKGHIDLAMAVFPYGTAGCQIDALAREPLWRARRNFGHGTGHGVGFFLGVHEGPAEIRQNFNRQAILPNMVFSDEPGIYRAGMHGIRHENMLYVSEDGINEFGRWMKFETLTLCHIDTSPIIKSLLTKEETEWLNNYNEKVYNTLNMLLPSKVAEWLKEKTAPI